MYSVVIISQDEDFVTLPVKEVKEALDMVHTVRRAGHHAALETTGMERLSNGRYLLERKPGYVLAVDPWREYNDPDHGLQYTDGHYFRNYDNAAELFNKAI